MGTFTPAMRLVNFKNATALTTVASSTNSTGLYTNTSGENKRGRFKFMGLSSNGSHQFTAGDLRLLWTDHNNAPLLFHTIPIITGLTTVSTSTPFLPTLTDIELLKLRRKIQTLGENGIQQPLPSWITTGTAYNDSFVPEFWIGPGFQIEIRLTCGSVSGTAYANYQVLEEWS